MILWFYDFTKISLSICSLNASGLPILASSFPPSPSGDAETRKSIHQQRFNTAGSTNTWKKCKIKWPFMVFLGSFPQFLCLSSDQVPGDSVHGHGEWEWHRRQRLCLPHWRSGRHRRARPLQLHQHCQQVWKRQRKLAQQHPNERFLRDDIIYFFKNIFLKNFFCVCF